MNHSAINPIFKKGEPQMEIEQLAKIFKALGHPTRIKIIEYLLERDSCICGEIVDIFPFSQSTISQHLKLLKDSAIVDGEIEGPKTCYCVNRNILNQFKRYVSSLIVEEADVKIV